MLDQNNCTETTKRNSRVVRSQPERDLTKLSDVCSRFEIWSQNTAPLFLSPQTDLANKKTDGGFLFEMKPNQEKKPHIYTLMNWLWPE